MVLEIRRFGDPILRERARRVREVDEYIRGLIEDMKETLSEAGGVGLAAPQVGVPLRVIIVALPEEEPFALINPEVLRRSGERVVKEGCLSFPGYWGEVKRSIEVRVKGRDEKGREVRIKARELLAQVLEHEIDHLDGILFIDRLESPDKLYREEG